MWAKGKARISWNGDRSGLKVQVNGTVGDNHATAKATAGGDLNALKGRVGPSYKGAFHWNFDSRQLSLTSLYFDGGMYLDGQKPQGLTPQLRIQVSGKDHKVYVFALEGSKMRPYATLTFKR